MTGNEAPLIYVIAGEASGDALGAALVVALRQTGTAFNLAGVGGPKLAEAGLTSLFPMEDLSVMGLTEVLPRLPLLLRRIRETSEDVIARRPAVMVTIDSPDFCFRVAKKVRARLPETKFVHYNAPTVWAWRPGRARKIAGFLDHLLCLYPFEPPYFEHEGLAATFVGHPLAGRFPDPVPADDSTEDAGERLVVLPGSRQSELGRLIPAFGETLAHLSALGWRGEVTLPTLDHLQGMVADATAAWPIRPLIVTGEAEKLDTFRRSGVALAASGTVALELAACGTPGVIGYKVSPLTAAIGRRLIKVPHVSLVNILMKQEVMPEFLQEDFQPEVVATALFNLLQDPAARRAQRVQFQAAMAQLAPPGGADPAALSAGVIRRLLEP